MKLTLSLTWWSYNLVFFSHMLLGFPGKEIFTDGAHMCSEKDSCMIVCSISLRILISLNWASFFSVWVILHGDLVFRHLFNIFPKLWLLQISGSCIWTLLTYRIAPVLSELLNQLPNIPVSSATLVIPDSCPKRYIIPKFTEHTLLLSIQYVASPSFFFLEGHSNLWTYNMGSLSVYILSLLINE